MWKQQDQNCDQRWIRTEYLSLQTIDVIGYLLAVFLESFSTTEAAFRPELLPSTVYFTAGYSFQMSLLASFLVSVFHTHPLYNRLLCSAALQQCLNANEH